jgi:hypothetical protein
LFDTREGLGVRSGKLRTGVSLDVPVAGRAGVPASGVTAVVLNLTVTEAESRGWLRLAPTGSSAGTTSNVNFDNGDTVPNLVICPVGSGGRITLTGKGDGMHALADVFGFFGPSGALLRATPPNRVLDTRIALGAERTPVGPSHGVRLAVAGRGGVPEGATAVVMNMTATNVSARSFLTVWPAGETRPGTSNLNIVPGQTRANLVICRLGAGGAIEIANPRAETDVIADVLGYFQG